MTTYNQAATARMFHAFCGRNHAEVEAALADHADPNAVDADGNPAIFSIQPNDTRSLVLLLKAGANPDGERYVIDRQSQKTQAQTTLMDELADDLSEATPTLRSQLHRIKLLLAAGASLRGVQGVLADHYALLDRHKDDVTGVERERYEETMGELQKTIELVVAIHEEEGKKARHEEYKNMRPTLEELFPKPSVTDVVDHGTAKEKGYVHFGSRAGTN